MCGACCNHVVIRFLLLQHQMHCANIIVCKTPVTFRFEVSERETFLHAQFDFCKGNRYFAGDEMLSAARRFVVEKNPGADKETVPLSVANNEILMCLEFGLAIRRDGSKGRALVLRRR